MIEWDIAQSFESFRYSEHKDLILLNDLQGMGIRNIAIMYIKTEYRNGIKYLLVLGVDIFTQKLVRLVDTYGKQYGLCKYCDDFKNVKQKTVIKVPCKLYDGPYLNTLRIVGSITVIGETNFGKLLKKFYDTQPMAFMFFPYSKIDVPCFMTILKNNPEKEFYARVHISSTIRKHQDKKYQIKFSSGEINRFADILDEKFFSNKHNLDGKFIKGIALVKGVLINGGIRVYVVEICNYSIYESKRLYDKQILIKNHGQYFSERYIDKLLEEGYTAKSKSIPGPENAEDIPFLNSYGNQYYENLEIDEDFGEYEEDIEFSLRDYELDYGYMEDEDYAE